MSWTEEQKKAIEKNGANILVSAAAGSGKTTVLVARIINKVLNENIDIDKLLVVTFTNAAASEMKERLLKEIYERLDKNPNDENLQKQIGLINNTHISTIHSFCLDVIRNNFFEIGMSANFRVADETEVELIKQQVIEEIFEEKYETQDEKFLRLLDLYTKYKDDTPLKDIILKMYDFISSVPYPEKWLEEAVEEFNIDDCDFSKTKWGITIMKYTENLVNDYILNLELAKTFLAENPVLIEFYNVISKDIDDLKKISFENWDNTCRGLNSKIWDDWPTKRKMEESDKELKEKAKAIRDDVKTSYTNKVAKLFPYESKEAIIDIKEMYFTLLNLKEMVFEFEKKFKNAKIEKNIVDFNDIEHLALNLLLDENGNKTEIAKRYDFNEILVDEYQDSNMLQEKILTSVSNGKNIFMVGDVKQSIYRFREARPDLFLNKYDTYKLVSTDSDETVENNKLDEDTKIQLYKNFRSRENVLEFTNLVFQNIMSKELGEINYTKEEYLNFAGSFDEPKINCDTEIYVIETEFEEKNEIYKTDVDEEKEKIKNEDEEIVDKATLEARFLCEKIKELNRQNINYKDMAILLRSPSTTAPIYEKELTQAGIPVFTDTASDYLESIEIDTILSLLKIIDNPLQDIPLVTILRSPICGFNDNELIKMRLEKRDGPFYYALENIVNKADEEMKGEQSDEDIKLANKIKRIIEMLDHFRKLEKKIPLDELIWKIYAETGYYHYVRLMPNGKLRQANLRKLFEKAKEYEKISFKGVFNFISFIEKVENKKIANIAEAKIIGENDEVVRIMSIHKSKGLEFPVCFIGGVGKNFNLRDMSEKIIYDQDFGIGVNYVSEQNQYPTLTKEAINIKARKEAISEEMRILYVALTRAKEKLIIVGCDKNALKNLEKKEVDITKYHAKDKPSKLNSKLVEKYTRYLDWLELVYKYNPEKNIKFDIIKREQLKSSIADEDEIINLENLKKEANPLKYKKIDELLNWEYKYKDAIDLMSKTSVTSLKNENIEIEQNQITVIGNDKNSEETIKNEIKVNNEIIGQDKGEQKLTAAEKGTLIHLVLQKIDSKDIKNTIENLKLNDAEKSFLQEEKRTFENYINSKLFEELQNAKESYKEMPFYMNIEYGVKGEKVLMQGIIDLYYITKDEKLILVDYKTDKNVNENILKERYKNQLDMYKIALEKSMKRNVDRVYIYSTFLNDIIEIK